MKSNIRKLRNEKQISQTELAEVIGKTQQTVSHMERDRDRISIESLIAMSEYFGVSTDCILGINDKESSETSMEKEKDQSVQSDFADKSENVNNIASSGNVKLLYDMVLSMLLCSLQENLHPVSETK